MGLRWLSLMWPVMIPWAGRVRALPFLTVLDYATGIALWYRSGQPVVPLRWMPLRTPAGVRAPMALLCSAPHTIAAWFLRRWQVEVIPGSALASGRETQHWWAAPAIALTTPRPAGPLGRVTVGDHALPIFADALALVQLTLWTGRLPFSRSRPPSIGKNPHP